MEDHEHGLDKVSKRQNSVRDKSNSNTKSKRHAQEDTGKLRQAKITSLYRHDSSSSSDFMASGAIVDANDAETTLHHEQILPPAPLCSQMQPQDIGNISAPSIFRNSRKKSNISVFFAATKRILSNLDASKWLSRKPCQPRHVVL